MTKADKELIALVLEKEAAIDRLNKLKDKADLLIENANKGINIMFHYTVKSSLKLFPDFFLNCPEALKTGSLVEISGIRYEVYRKICKIIEAPNVTETILMMSKL